MGEDRTTGLALRIKGQGGRSGDPTLDDQIGQGQRRAGRDDAAITQRIERRRLGEGIGNGPVAGGITAGQGQRFVNAHHLGRRGGFNRLAAATRHFDRRARGRRGHGRAHSFSANRAVDRHPINCGITVWGQRIRRHQTGPITITAVDRARRMGQGAPGTQLVERRVTRRFSPLQRPIPGRLIVLARGDLFIATRADKTLLGQIKVCHGVDSATVGGCLGHARGQCIDQPLPDDVAGATVAKAVTGAHFNRKEAFKVRRRRHTPCDACRAIAPG